MKAYGMWQDRRVVIEISGRDKALCLVDDDSGKEIDRHSPGSSKSLHLAGNALTFGERLVTLDRGEEKEANALLQLHSRGLSPASSVTVVAARRSGSDLPDGDISQDELMREMQRQDVIDVSRRAATVASIVTGLLVLFGVLAVIAGLFIAFAGDSNAPGEVHPNFASGITIVIAGLAEVCLGLMVSLGVGAVARYIRYRAEFDPVR